MTAMKGNEEQKWVRAPTKIAAASAGEDAISTNPQLKWSDYF